MNDKTFLDVDETILTKILTLPENVSQIDGITKQPDSKPFFIIQPAPGICVKTKTDSGEKVFLNICTSDKIPAPEDISDEKLVELLLEENPNYFVPLSIGSERIEVDRGGSPCTIYDVAYNTTYFKKCENRKNFLLFTIQVTISAVSDKFNKTLNVENYVILKNRKAMGKIQQHRIENREPRMHSQVKKPLITEIESPIKNIHKEENKVIQSENVSIEPKLNYVLLKQPLKGPATHLIGLFQVPKGTTGKDVEVLLDENRIVITVDNTTLAYDLSVPYTINITRVKCLLDKDLRVLRLDMPVRSALDNVQN
ncbi:PIH1 domain-containing protein 1-like [Hylaeus anthracinus]|uniref:PIH1 domain-containing protein 1-like n=1 Tax=Hylaeus anthracinus TaxID=313031 RepID=UPI0023BA1BEB|nr:PIH1 domain-containing protein 1-like [Hylaeus anthracinus]